MLEYLKHKFKFEDKIGEPPYKYDFIIRLEKREYPKYLKKIFKTMTGEELNLKNPHSFNEKIQWLKLYDSTPLKTKLTDKVLVRDWVKDKIGEEYLKPLLQICKNFDDINFDKLPEKFIIKANNGCKWHYKIKDKQAFLQHEKLKNFVKMKFDIWMNQTFFPFAGFEMQYKNIDPQIIIEPLLSTDDGSDPIEYEVFCFNGMPKIYQRVIYSVPCKTCVYDENFNRSEISFNPDYVIQYDDKVSDNLKKASVLSEILAKEFKFVRVDWIECNGLIYFNEMTFTPYSGFYKLDKKINKKLGNMLTI